MDQAERRALAALRFNWAPTPDDVWRPAPFHVDGLHESTTQLIMDGFDEAAQGLDSSPIGVVVLGDPGVGKTHLLGTVRQRVQAAGGYFFLVSLLDLAAFWRSTVLSILDSFAREDAAGRSQLRVFLADLVDRVGAPRTVRRAVTAETALSRHTLDAFVDLLRKTNRQVGIECQDTARALVLHAADDPRAQDIGHAFLCSNDEEEPGDRSGWGIRRGRRSAQEVVRDLSWLLALSGPTVIAIDQIDQLVAQSALLLDGAPADHPGGDAADWQFSLQVERIAGGLMALRQTTRRTLSVVACLPVVWKAIKQRATATVQDRFREASPLRRIPSAQLGGELVARRFAEKFTQAGFRPPYPTWPVRPEAFAEADQFTPRELLRTIDTHVRSCLADGQARELDHLLLRHRAEGARPAPQAAQAPGPATPAADAPATDPAAPQLLALDARYAELIAAADPAGALHQDTEDGTVPDLIAAGLTAWIAELGPAGEAFTVDPRPGGRPALHARLRRRVDERSDDEEHWAFRAISAPHHIAALNRIRNASTAAGLTEGVPRRRLFLLRNPDWSPGARTREVLGAFTAAGGRRLPFPAADVARLAALQKLLSEQGREGLQPWLTSRRPASEITFLAAALAGAAPGAGQRAGEKAADAGQPGGEPTGARAPRVPPSPADAPPNATPTNATGGPDHAVPLGAELQRGGPVRIELAALRRHVVIFAGSGSGKTVLIRRLVEECALRGVSAIVLDPNNDLARLGDPWPQPPAGWGPDDPELARAYLSGTEVVVWTPGRAAGRALSFQPLPDFGGILDDPDAFASGIDAAVAALAPRARVDGGTARAQLGQAVLREALTSYARQGSSELRGLIDLLADLPDGLSQLDNARKIASDLAQLLTASTVNDPLFAGDGAPADPGLLLTPAPGYRARISVISFIGLDQEAKRQSFVNRLQLALIAWMKRNPAGDRPLGGLFVMDEAQTLAPSDQATAATHSTLFLAAQARKYGLGLVFATQAPKGLHNRISGNAATQLFGLLHSPAQIGAARELARVKGSDVPGIGGLRAGQFYAAVEGAGFTLLRAPLCLSHHPPSPLTLDEVLARAQRRTAAPV